MIRYRVLADNRKQWGQAATEYAILLALVALVVIGALIILGGGVRDALAQVTWGEQFEEGSGQVTVMVVDYAMGPIANVPVFVYGEDGDYLHKNGKTDGNGRIVFDLANGRYRFLAQHQLEWFWSEVVLLKGNTSTQIETGQRPFTVYVQDIVGNPLEAVPVLAYTEAGDYIGVSSETEVSGTAVLPLVNNTLQFRADYQGKTFWSDPVPVTDEKVTITISPCSTDEFLAEYFNNRTLSGDPAFVRCEADISNNWGQGGPGNGVTNDNFSVRWTGQVRFEEGKYSFIATSDDGVRVWVDDKAIIDAWKPQSATAYRAPQSLTAGTHTIKMHYFEQSGYAVASLSWDKLVDSCPTGQYLTEYYNNNSLSGDPNVVRCESTIRNNWGSGSPANGVGSNSFSVRWHGRFAFDEGTYTFRTTADDGVRVWVDGDLLIDGWRDQSSIIYTGRKTLTAGEHEIRMDYYENSGDAVAVLTWEPTVVSCPDGQFLAEYFNNRNLMGDPVLSRCENQINNRWKTGGPGEGVANDNFSVQWTGRFSFDGDTYTIAAAADDGIQVYIDNQVIINAWRNQSETQYQQNVTLTAGWHEVKVNYYENGGYATAVVDWRK